MGVALICRTRTIIFIIFSLVLIRKAELRSIELRVDPYPVRLYQNAPPGKLVLTITGFDNVTGAPLENVTKSIGSDATYFKVLPAGNKAPNTRWFLLSTKTIDKPVNFTFSFMIYGTYNGVVRDQNVKIIVSEENLFPPEFEQPKYEFVIYRNSTQKGLVKLGEVKAVDEDRLDYNSNFQYFIFGRNVTKYFHIDPLSGGIGIFSDIPPEISEFNFNVTAIDSGSPQKKSSVPVNVVVSDIPPPEIFCVSVEGPKARICWKDPTNGSYVEKYQLQFAINGQNVTRHPVSIFGKRNEVCTQVKAGKLEAGNRLKFTVKVFDANNWSPSSVQRFVNITKDGLYGDCHTFSNCSVWQPCKNRGECKTKPDLSYTCECKSGWAGRNCTDTDLCSTQPCLNGGSCQFLSHRNFKCQCPPDYFGKRCQFHDKCSTNPCKNGGTCFKFPNGTFQCECPAHFTGSRCEREDPCHPNPCQNQGVCNEDQNSNYQCVCKSGYYGKNCSYVDICKLRNPCSDGECVRLGDSKYRCNCTKGKIGVNCTETDLCYYKLCQNNATCVLNNSIAKCVCPETHYGEKCQYYNTCRDLPCNNSAKCENKNDGSYSCKCDNGFYGNHCEYFNPCSSSPCEYQGTCVNISNTEYKCTCHEERYGRNCEFVNGCKINPCENNSTCTNTSTDGNVTCACLSGYFGHLCERFNPCTSHPCENNGICQNISNTEFKCHCGMNWAGKLCEHRNACLRSPCQNSATCLPENDTYSCDCKEFFYGKDCDKYEFCSPGANMCRNQAVCELHDTSWHQVTINKTTLANVTNWFKCRCPDGFTGLQCENEVKPCDLKPCGKGICRETGGGHVCDCPDGTVRDNCRTETCEGDTTTQDRTGRYHWPRTLPGMEASIMCPHGAKHHDRAAYAHKKCRIALNGYPEWLPTDTTECMEYTTADADQMLRNLMSYTDDASKLTPEQVANVTHDLENVALFALENQTLAAEMTTVISNLLEAKESVLIESSTRNHSSERLVELLTEYTDAINTDSNVTIDTENINLMVVNISADEQKMQPFIYEPLHKLQNKEADYGVKMKFPGEVVKGTGSDRLKIKFVTYRTSAFFIPKIPTPEEIVLKQRVLTASIHGVKVQNLSTPIHYSIENIDREENHTCVFWDKNRWSTDGVYTSSTGGNTTDCYTTHLTSFSIILDPTPTVPLPEIHEKTLTFISYIGCAISIFGLAFTIVTYSMFRSLNRDRSGKILLNMCVSMLLMNTTFILMAETTGKDGEALCIVIAILLHYFLLTSLMWMLTEAINMYQALIKVFTKYSSYFILKRCLIAWGLPAVVVAATMGVNALDNYRSKTDFCFISQANPIAFYATLLGPACVILVINTVVFTLVARVIMKPRFKGSVGKNEKVTPAQVRGAFTVMVLLGVTWVFDLVAINESKLVFNYLFTILNSLQGFLIFVFRCLMNNEARMAWALLIKTGTFKRRRGPIKSAFGDSSSSKAYADYRVNGSSGDSAMHTGKTSLSSNGNLHNVIKSEKNGDAHVSNGHTNGHVMNGRHNNNGKHITENGKNKDDYSAF